MGKTARKHPVLLKVLPLALCSVIVSCAAGDGSPEVLGDSTVVSILGVLLGGDLAIIAVLQPSLQDLRSVAADCDAQTRAKALRFEEGLQRELRQDFTSALALFLGFFVLACVQPVIGAVPCPLPCWPVVPYNAAKVFAVGLSSLALADTVSPSFSLAEVVSRLHDIEAEGGAPGMRSA